MDDEKGKVIAFPGGGEEFVRKVVAGRGIPTPPPGYNFDRQGLRPYDWIAEALERDGRNIKPAFESMKRWRRGSAAIGRRFRISEGMNQERLVVAASVLRSCGVYTSHVIR